MLGRAQASVFYFIQDVLGVPVFYKFFDKIPEFARIRLEEGRGFGDIRFVTGIADNPVFRIIMEVGAGHQVDVLVPYGLVVIPERCGIRPRLVRGMGGFGVPVLKTCFNQGVLVGQFCR